MNTGVGFGKHNPPQLLMLVVASILTQVPHTTLASSQVSLKAQNAKNGFLSSNTLNFIYGRDKPLT